MGIGDIIRGGVTHSSTPIQINKGRARPPIRFTQDPFEYIESNDFLGEKLYPVQKKILELFFSKDEKSKRKYQELILICGMRSGKSLLASWLGTFALNQLMYYGPEYKEVFKISKSTTVTIPCIASSEAQVDRTIFAYVRKILLNSSFWKKVNDWLQSQEPIGQKGTLFFEDNQNVRYGFYDIVTCGLPSTSDTLAGLTSYCTLFDEISRLNISDTDIHGKTQKKSAQAIYYTLTRQTKTFKREGTSIVVSSPMFEDDFGMQLMCKSATLITGKAGEYTVPILASRYPRNQKKNSRIAFHYATWEYNQELSEDDFEEERKESLSSFKRDYMALPPATVSPFIDDRSVIESSIVNRPHIVDSVSDTRTKKRIDESTGMVLEERSYVVKQIKNCLRDKVTPRFICCDQAEKEDLFVLGIAHPELKEVEKEGVMQKFFKTYVDALLVWEPLDNGQITIDFDNVEKVILELTKYLNILAVTYDRWQSTKSIQSLFDNNVNSQILSVTNAMYQSFKTRLYAGLVDSPEVYLETQDNKKELADELMKLQKIRTKIDHPKNGRKDVSDVVCRLDALIQNYEYENFGTGKQRMIGSGVSIDPSSKNFNTRNMYSDLNQAYGTEGGIWGDSEDAPKSFTTPFLSPTKNIWGRPGVRNIKKSPADRKQHPAQDFFKMKR